MWLAKAAVVAIEAAHNARNTVHVGIELMSCDPRALSCNSADRLPACCARQRKESLNTMDTGDTGDEDNGDQRAPQSPPLPIPGLAVATELPTLLISEPITRPEVS